MVLHGLAIYKYVIEIDNNEFANQRSQDVIHKTHKSGRSIGQTKWHDEPFIETEFGLEGRLPFVSNGHLIWGGPIFSVSWWRCDDVDGDGDEVMSMLVKITTV